MCIFDINCQWPEPLYCTNLIQPTAPDDAGKGECSYQCNFIVFKLKNKKRGFDGLLQYNRNL